MICAAVNVRLFMCARETLSDRDGRGNNNKKKEDIKLKLKLIHEAIVLDLKCYSTN